MSWHILIDNCTSCLWGRNCPVLYSLMIMCSIALRCCVVHVKTVIMSRFPGL